LLNQSQHGTHFVRLRQHPVSVQVDAQRIGSLACFQGPILVGSAKAAAGLMAIHIEHWDEHHHQVVQGVLLALVGQKLAHQNQTGVFAVNFTRMGAANDQQHWQLTPLGRGRVQDTGFAHHQGFDVATLGTGAHVGAFGR